MSCSRSPEGVVSQHALQVSRSTSRGEVEGDLAGGVSRPTPGEGAPLWRGTSFWGEGVVWRPLPTSGRLLLRTLRILLECILVLLCC